MGKELEELTLLLLYLTSWEEEEIHRSWKGYLFEILNKLEKEDIISQGRGSKSVCLTEKGIELAEKLKEKYKIQE